MPSVLDFEKRLDFRLTFSFPIQDRHALFRVEPGRKLATSIMWTMRPLNVRRFMEYILDSDSRMEHSPLCSVQLFASS